MTRRSGFLLLGLLVALLLAGVVSGFASSSPDGLERVAEDKGFLSTAEDSALADSPVADYAVEGVEDERLSTGLAGVIGVTVTFVFGLGLFALVRKRDSGSSDGEAPAT
ncbi:MAG: PDGLE domain-containing protein [Actinomycetes bacterium]